MTIVIGLKKGLPVKIGDLDFSVDTSDANIERIANNADAIFEDFKAVDGSTNLEVAKAVLKRGFDFLLGEGAFEQIYQELPSTVQLVSVLEELAVQLTNELSKISGQTQQQKVHQFLQHKSKKQGKKKRKR